MHIHYGKFYGQSKHNTPEYPLTLAVFVKLRIQNKVVISKEISHQSFDDSVLEF